MLCLKVHIARCDSCVGMAVLSAPCRLRPGAVLTAKG